MLNLPSMIDVLKTEKTRKEISNLTKIEKTFTDLFDKVQKSSMSMAYVGDSRTYLIRDNTITQLTTDHSLVSEQLKRGVMSKKEARESRLKNVITRALGMEKSVEIGLDEQVILNNDYILMCSDGLYDMVEDGEILSMILRFPKKPQEACDRLIELSNDHGGNDNISVILLHLSK